MVEIKVLSWNIAHQSTLPGDIQSLLDWPTRLDTILQTLRDANADIIMLQEVNLDTLDADFKSLEYKYKSIAHIHNKKRTNVFGNVTFWPRRFRLLQSKISSRAIHIKLLIGNITVTISNVHLPAMNGHSGYLEKLTHVRSCIKSWKTDPAIIVGGDFNDSFTFRDKAGNIAGLFTDISALGFRHAEGELGKKTCKSFRSGNIHNVDHVLVRGNLEIAHIASNVNVDTIPSRENPSDHIPIEYMVAVEDAEFDKPIVRTTPLYVIDALDSIRKYAPFPRPLCDIIASYSMIIGDLLAYMPYIWKEDYSKPYEYPCGSYSRRVYCNGRFLLLKLDNVEQFKLEGVNNLYRLLTRNVPNITRAAAKNVSDYYERIARECLDELLSRQ